MSARSLSTEKTAGPFRTLRRLAFRGVTRLVSAFRELWGGEHPSRRASLFRIRIGKNGRPGARPSGAWKTCKALVNRGSFREAPFFALAVGRGGVRGRGSVRAGRSADQARLHDR